MIRILQIDRRSTVGSQNPDFHLTYREREREREREIRKEGQRERERETE